MVNYLQRNKEGNLNEWNKEIYKLTKKNKELLKTINN